MCRGFFSSGAVYSVNSVFLTPSTSAGRSLVLHPGHWPLSKLHVFPTELSPPGRTSFSHRACLRSTRVFYKDKLYIAYGCRWKTRPFSLFSEMYVNRLLEVPALVSSHKINFTKNLFRRIINLLVELPRTSTIEIKLLKLFPQSSEVGKPAFSIPATELKTSVHSSVTLPRLLV